MNTYRATARAVPFLAAAALAACAILGPSTVSDITADYDPGEYARATQARAIPVTVRSGALGVDRAALTEAIAKNMAGHDVAGHGRFTATPTNGGDSVFSFAFAIDPPAQEIAEELCTDRSVSSAVPAVNDGNVRLIGALCRYNQAVTTVDGQASGVSGPNDPTFATLIAAATRDLTPVTTTDPLKDSIEPN
ncbi:MAG TPA: hypothetical protein VFO61_03325 [Alphaproteobacteria bacterium]|nr:hypothetical protein [Alphaproteobacteria bacterium]